MRDLTLNEVRDLGGTVEKGKVRLAMKVIRSTKPVKAFRRGRVAILRGTKGGRGARKIGRKVGPEVRRGMKWGAGFAAGEEVALPALRRMKERKALGKSASVEAGTKKDIREDPKRYGEYSEGYNTKYKKKKKKNDADEEKWEPGDVKNVEEEVSKLEVADLRDAITKDVTISSLRKGKEVRGKRDGTGPFEGSYQRRISGKKGRRQLAGEKCPVPKRTSR